jgi:hypothetical protein
MDTQPAPPAPPAPDVPDDLAPPPADPADPDDPDDLVPPGAPPPAGVPTAEQFSATLVERICKKVMACGFGATDDLCGAVAQSGLLGLGDPGGGQCRYDARKARRCLQAIDALPCGGGGLDLQRLDLGVLLQFEDCSDALRC